MEDEKKIEQPEQEAESSETSRREFVGKLVTAAGAAALAGLLAGAGADEAEADIQTPQVVKIDKHMEWRMGKFQTLKLNNGFRLSMSGRELGTALRSAGLLQEGTNLDNATLTIEFTA